MTDIRKLCVSDEKVREEWIKSLQPMAEVLNERTTRVALKGKKFEVRNPASDQDVVTTEDSVIAKVDKTIVKGKYQAKDLSSNKEFHTFLKSHCRLRTYTFQIRKCDDRKCCLPIKMPSGLLPWLPDSILSANEEHFLRFDQIIGETTEKDCPSTMIQSAAEVTEYYRQT